jgi:hypothetical protein
MICDMMVIQTEEFNLGIFCCLIINLVTKMNGRSEIKPYDLEFQESQEQQEAHQGPTVEENFITGPPASRTVIDNLKKLLVQRQHSRESDYEVRK